jgi:hypothetical protein
MQRCAWLLLVPLIASCSKPTSYGAPAVAASCGNLSERSIPAGWKSALADNGFSFHLPQSCTSSELSTPHGGTHWECGSLSVDLVWGRWGADSFGEGQGRKMKVQEVDAFEQVTTASGTRRRIIWYKLGGPHEPLLSAWSDNPADASNVDALVASGYLVDQSIQECAKKESRP